MRISGKKVADEIKADLILRIEDLRKKNIKPKIAIITLGPEGAWETYVRQKLKVATELGIEAVFIPLGGADEKSLLKKIEEINQDKSFHGMIVQRPMPGVINKKTVTDAIAPEKDVDGFQENSKFEVPVWLATKRLIEVSLAELGTKKKWSEFNFVILGKGETAGAPAIKALKKLGAEPMVIDSKTRNPNDLIKNADIVITSVGKSRVINKSNIKPGVILIGVGTHVANEDGKLHGDYEESEIENLAGSYTPTPGGVGPVNLSYLFQNLVEAAEAQIKNA